ncbi:hypothetical protein DL93DRAFT_2166737 [Clavulina sp. PMI_390]|nr:hypothetical protein DL93DRAFT_2166737 [Clavulina sp. PMI_390]
MFDTPRRSTGFSQNLLTSSIYSDTASDLDPWGSASITPGQTVPSPSANNFSAILGTAAIPSAYQTAFESVIGDSFNDGIPLNALIRVLRSSDISASVTDKIISLVSSEPRVSRLEFYVALALVGLAQEGADISIEQVAMRAQQDSLPDVKLDRHRIVDATMSAAFPSTSSDPWGATPGSTVPDFRNSNSRANGLPAITAGDLGEGWWKRLARAEVSIIPEKQGFILARYTAYTVITDRGSVTRRYSEFAYLFDCLVQRYPFRIIPSLPPKRLGGDSTFLEQRRKGLQRFLNYALNHPVLRDDGLLNVFMTEPNLEAWRRHSSISLEEEASHKKVGSNEEMSIPRDLEDRFSLVREKLPALIEQWTKICTMAERILKRNEANSDQSDLSRLTMTLNALGENHPRYLHSEQDDLHAGVQRGIQTASRRFTILADSLERRARASVLTSLEALKSQRDLYIATRDLFARHDRLSGDAVDRLKKRIATNSTRLETIKRDRKDGWEIEADKLLSSMEVDQGAIAAALARRVFIRYAMWHELRVVLYNRENTLIAVALQEFARLELAYTESVTSTWGVLVDELSTIALE